MRVLLIALLAMAVAWLVANSFREEAPPTPTVTRQQKKDCRDLCEQTAIVEQLGERYLQNCRARCDGPPVPKEPIHRITVAPADHRSTLREQK